jgi:hypothetical protein
MYDSRTSSTEQLSLSSWRTRVPRLPCGTGDLELREGDVLPEELSRLWIGPDSMGVMLAGRSSSLPLWKTAPARVPTD